MLLPAGAEGSSAVAALDRAVADGMLRTVMQLGRAVVIDAPPLDESLAAVELMRAGARGLLVVAVGLTEHEELVSTVETLRRTGGDLGGVLVNRPRRPRRPRRGDQAGTSAPIRERARTA